MNDAAVEEFDTMAGWTADAVAALGPEHALPAACRGSGSPAALDWLADQLGLRAGMTLVDSGAGVGGPAEYVATRRGVLPTPVEPMVGACRAAGRLFARAGTAGDGSALPFRDAGADRGFDAGWSLGVLCTVEDKERHLAELARTVRTGGGVGLLVFVRLVDELPEEPDANHFPTLDELENSVRRAGLVVEHRAPVSDFAAAPPEWQDATARVDDWIEREHGEETGWRAARREQQVVVDLIEGGLVVGQLLSCRRPGSVPTRDD